MDSEEVIPDIPFELTNDLDKKIFEKFRLYDELETNAIPFELIPLFIRSLGLFVTNEEVNKIIEACKIPKLQNKLHIAMLLPYLSKCFFGHQYMPPSHDQILEAFHEINPDKKGTIKLSEAVEIFTKYGEPFNADEMKEFLVRAVDQRTKEINYEYLTNTLKISFKDENNLYKLADDIEAAKPKSKSKPDLLKLLNV